VVLLLGMLVAGCRDDVRADPVIDTFPVGSLADCRERCLPAIAVATDAFDALAPGHPAIVKVTLHDLGREVNAAGEVILQLRSGGPMWVAVFELEDGSVRAIGVGYPGVSREPVAFDSHDAP